MFFSSHHTIYTINFIRQNLNFSSKLTAKIWISKMAIVSYQPSHLPEKYILSSCVVHTIMTWILTTKNFLYNKIWYVKRFLCFEPEQVQLFQQPINKKTYNNFFSFLKNSHGIPLYTFFKLHGHKQFYKGIMLCLLCNT